MSTSSQGKKETTIILESYLVKTGPLNKALPLSWRQRWFVFSRNPEGVIDLSYFTDETKSKKKGYIDLTKFLAIKPSVSVGGRESLFALEITGRTYIMQAANGSSKNVWLAKLYEMLSGDRVYHASVPQQTQLPADEALMRIISKNELTLVNPTTAQALCSIDYTAIRRHGSCGQVLWFELCPCVVGELKLFFWTITAGSTVCAQIAKEHLKVYVEQRNQKHMVAENLQESQIFTSQCHFSCSVPMTSQTSGVPAQVRVVAKTKRRPTELQKKSSEHFSATTISSLNSPPPPQSPRALNNNSRQNSMDSVFVNSPEPSASSSGGSTLATFRDRQFSFASEASHSPAAFDPTRSLANFRQNSAESCPSIVSPIQEEKPMSTTGGSGNGNNQSTTDRSGSPYPLVGRDSGVESQSEGELSPGSNCRKLEHKNSISSVGSNHSSHSGEQLPLSPLTRTPVDQTRQPPATPPRSEISLRIQTQRVAQTAS